MLKLLEDNFVESTSFHNKVALLQAAENHRAFATPDKDKLEDLNLKLRLWLEDGKSRLEGLLLLNSMLPQCTEGFFEANAYYWIQFATAVIRGHGDYCSEKLATKIIEAVIIKSEPFPLLRKDIGEKVVPKLIFGILDKTAEDECLPALLDCLALCMKTMPSYCCSNRVLIQDFLVSQFEYLAHDKMESIAGCFSLLPLIGERAFCNSDHYAKNWCSLAEILLNELAKSLNFLYAGHVEGLEVWPTDNALKLPTEPEDLCSAFICHSQRFQTFTLCLVKMFSQSNRMVKAMAANCVRIVRQAFKVSPAQLICTDVHASALYAILPTIHYSTLLFIEALILCGPESELINEDSLSMVLVKKLLSNSSEVENSHGEGCCSFIRCSIYKLLRILLQKCSRNSFEIMYNRLMMEALNDIMPVASNRKSSLSTAANYLNESNPRTLKERRQMQLLGPAKALPVQINRPASSAVCTEALRFLSSLLYANYNGLNLDCIKDLHKAVIGHITAIQCSPVFPSPYENDTCRLELYKLFLNIIVHSTSISYSPLSVSMHIFRNGEKDTNFEISSYCLHASMVCVAIINPERTLPKVCHISEETAKQKSITPSVNEVVIPSVNEVSTLNIESVQCSGERDWGDTSAHSMGDIQSHAQIADVAVKSKPSSKNFSHKFKERENASDEHSQNTEEVYRNYVSPNEIHEVCEEEDDIEEIDDIDEEEEEEEDLADEEDEEMHEDDEMHEEDEEIQEEEEDEMVSEEEEEDGEIEEDDNGKKLGVTMSNHQANDIAVSSSVDDCDNSSFRLTMSESADETEAQCISQKRKLDSKSTNRENHISGNVINENGLGSSDSEYSRGSSSSHAKKKFKKLQNSCELSSPEESQQCSTTFKGSLTNSKDNARRGYESDGSELKSLMKDFISMSPDDVPS